MTRRDNADDAKRISRREFFRTVGRGAALAGLGAAGVALAMRSGTTARPTGQSCINRGVCSGCGVFDGCALPPALSAKRAGRSADG